MPIRPTRLHTHYSIRARLMLCAFLCLFIQPGFAQQTPSADTSVATSLASTAEPATTTTTPSATATDASAASSAPAPYYTADGSKTKVGSGSHLLSVTMALLFIVILIMAVSWFIRRFGQGVLANTSHMKIIATMPLGTREKVLLVDVGGQQILLGVTATQINTLHVFEEPVMIASQAPTAPASDFSRKLMAVLQQKYNPAGSTNNNNSPGQG